jgi:hypothetical protein
LTSFSSNPANPVQSRIWHSIPLRAAFVILIGLVAAQVIASLHVHLSNLELHEKMQVLMDTGYLVVPNSHVLPRLLDWKQAVLGGLFFTLSLGVFLTLLSFAAAWFRHLVLPEKKSLLLVVVVPWLVLVLALNIRGFSLMATLYALVIPPLIFSAASRWLFKKSPDRLRPLTLFHALSPLLLALLWATQMEGSFFGDVRDYLLLSHSAGTKVSDFYYRYTLYPAEAFKSLDQKLIKTVFLDNIRSKAVSQALERELLKHDYLAISKEKPAELVITERDHELHLQKGGVTVSSAKLQQFLPSPAAWLADFSAKTDRHGFFRKFTFISLLIGFPLFLYLLLYGLLLLVLSPFLSRRTSSVVATSFCLLAGVLLFLLFTLSRGAIRDEGQVARALQSTDSKTRVTALKFIYDKGLEITRYPTYRDLLNSSFILERCWVAKALGTSRRSESFKELLSFLDDPHPTVVSATFQALAKRKNPAAIPYILSSIETSTDWYNQWNAYKALRALGWKQSRSR